MHVLDDLTARGLVYDVTDREGLAKLLAEGPVTFYCGYDPTAISLHVGNLVPLGIMRRLAMAGHRMVAVIGGATGMIGDPSGKTTERKLLDKETLVRNQEAISAQVKQLVAGNAIVLNNADWIAPLSLLDFLRDVGKLMTINYMLAKESVRARLEDREHGISYTEFSYMLLQAFDFTYLAKQHGCRLQIGASDQWGNITCGIELCRKMGGPELFGLVAPLLTDKSGVKFGKSEAGTSVWLDPSLTSPYRFYQFWVNTEDANLDRLLKIFTFLPLEEIDRVVREHQEIPSKRIGQRRLAGEVTTWVHGAEAARRAQAASEVMFGGSIENLGDADLEPLLADLPWTQLARAELEKGLPLVDLMARTKLVDSKGAARRLLSQGGVYVNNVRQDDPNRVLWPADLATETMVVLRAGKKSYHVLKIL
ncbi:MAG: tyrosine--tRNA ligase [Deltaproteobacteria bacterium]|nr:tyrosine--tRNA ligase [Deltaproteobacteria bacterium]